LGLKARRGCAVLDQIRRHANHLRPCKSAESIDSTGHTADFSTAESSSPSHAEKGYQPLPFGAGQKGTVRYLTNTPPTNPNGPPGGKSFKPTAPLPDGAQQVKGPRP
jgi:hypothetical protein